MINTGNKPNSMYITDDVNRVNIDEVDSLYRGAMLTIIDKFELPTSILEHNTGNINLDNKLKEIKQEFKNESQYNNFRAKIVYWSMEIFRDVIKEVESGVSINILSDNITKHEWMYIKWLYEIGVNILIISNKASELNIDDITENKANIKILVYNTSEHLKLPKEKEVKTLNEIEDILYNQSGEELNIIVKGIANYLDTCDFYARLRKESIENSVYMLVTNGFEKPTYNETSSIPRIGRDDKEYVINTTIDLSNKTLSKEMKNLLKEEISKEETTNNSIIYNKLVYTLCILDRINKGNKRVIIYYGDVKQNDKLALTVLNRADNISVIIVCSDKTKDTNVNGFKTLELEDTCEIFEMPLKDSRDNVSTLAYQAERRIQDTLYKGDTLGLYKPGQFKWCQVKHFNTTCDEIKLWWNKELYLRPGFEATVNTAIIPTMCKVIQGVNNNYLEMIQMFSCGKTVLCKKAGAITALTLKDTYNRRIGIERYYINNKLDREGLKGSDYYTYNYLSNNKQDLILDKIEELINNEYINKRYIINKTDYINLVLNLTLSLCKDILQYIQWFEFYTYNANIILILTDEKQLSLDEFILIAFFRLLGFDILIFVPTCYNSIEGLAGPEFLYDTHILGEPNYDITVDNIVITDNIEIKQESNKKKQGLFNKLFSKK